MNQRIILASQSPRRTGLLRQIGIEAEVIPSRIAEEDCAADPVALVQKLSYQKASEVWKRLTASREDGADDRSGVADSAWRSGGADAANATAYGAGSDGTETGSAAGVTDAGADSAGTGCAGAGRGLRTTIIGADTVVSIEGRILGKPASHQEAFEMIRALQGKVHQVYTGVNLISWVSPEGSAGKDADAPGAMDAERSEAWNATAKLGFVEKTDVEFYPLSEAEIRAYTETEEPMDKAGAYGIQGAFCKYIRRIHGDYFNVVGLPLGRLYHTLLLLEKGTLC